MESLRDRLEAEPELVIVFDDSIKGEAVRQLVDFGESLGIPVQYVCLVDYSNSRGAVRYGSAAGLLPGYQPRAGRHALDEMMAARSGRAVGGGRESARRGPGLRREAGFLVVQDMFLTETAQLADVVFPAASRLRKERHRHQRLRRSAAAEAAPSRPWAPSPTSRSWACIAREMGVAAALGPWMPDAVFEEIRKNVRGYDVPLPVLADRRRGADRCR